jgi:lipopolysaccharide biosynthesis glycosyltransferase
VVPAGHHTSIKQHHSSSSSTYTLPPCDSYASQWSWLKLLLHQLLPADVDSALYLDCDLLLLQDPCHIWRETAAMFEV